MTIDLRWEVCSTDRKGEATYVALHVGCLERTEVARLRRSNKGKWYFLEIDLPNFDLEQIQLDEQSSRPFDEQKRRAEQWVRRWFELAMKPHSERDDKEETEELSPKT